ncbi:MAG TPA: mechanosensitive ion channel domain-containing protein [Longimicrobiales bacterium]|jgi:small conductance mechanosensitive channel
MPDFLNQWTTTIQPLLAEWGVKALGAIVVLLVGWTVARSFRRAVNRVLERSPVDATLAPFLSGLVYFATTAFVILAALSLINVPVTSFIAVLGAVGLAIALAFQSTLSNFASGVLILTLRPFGVGDFVDAGGTAGTVKAVGVFQTTLATPDNVRIIVPNSRIAGETIRNFSANPTRRIDLVVGVSYDDDLDVAMSTIRQVLSEDARVLADPIAVVAVNEMADSSINFVVRPWVPSPDYWDTRWDLTKALKERLEAAGCSIPYPQRDVHLFQTGATGSTT